MQVHFDQRITMTLYQNLVPESHCDPIGSLTAHPSPSTGLCHCKPLVTGARCDQCVANSFHLSEESPNGCIDCFCFGVTKACLSSNWFRDYVELKFTNDPNVVRLTDLDNSVVIDRNFRIDYRNREIVYREFTLQPKLTYYWSLPPDFLGDKVVSYGGHLNYSFRFERKKNSIMLFYRFYLIILTINLRPGI